MFGIIVAACMIYNIEFKGSAVKKIYLLPMSVSSIYLCKFVILTILLFVAVCFQNLALTQIGITDLPQGTFEFDTLIKFAGYSFITAMLVLSIMLFISSRFENIWVPLGIGVAGFLSGMALGTSKTGLFLIDPFVVMIKPAVSMSAQPNLTVVIIALSETIFFFLSDYEQLKIFVMNREVCKNEFWGTVEN